MEEFYTIEEVSNILGVTRQTVSKYIKQEKINAVKLGKSYRIYKKDFADFINDNSISSENVIKYEAIDYEGFGFLNDLEKNGESNSNYKLKPKEINHDEEFNTFILGDNYFVLKQLLPKIRGKVDLIYIDPPFGTGQTFSDLDNNHAYEDTLVNDKFLSFLRDRLYLLKQCLSKKGSIYLHIDKKIGHYVKIIMDEVFGHKNFVNDITRIKCNPKNFKRKAYGNYSDMVLYYAKNKDKQIWNGLTEPLDQDDIDRLFPKEDEDGNRYTTHPIHAPGETEDGDTGKEWKGMMPPKGRHWRYSRKKLTKLDDDGRIEWSKNGNPRKIVYAKNHKGKKIQDVWKFKDKGKSYVDYPTQKNQDLLERIIKNSSNEGSLVLDCFAGSGSTLIAADKFNRKWIGIDNSDYSLETVSKKFNDEKIECNFVKLVKYELQTNQ
jgi:adenine-specific DNA-methyltransferase